MMMALARTRIRVVDLETTGFPPDAEPIEIAAVDVHVDGLQLPTIHGSLSPVLVRPVRPVPPESSAIHHLIDDDLAGSLPWSQIWPVFVTPAIDVWCEHSAKFERAFLTDAMLGGKPWICTWKCALRLWPEAPAHSNQALRYWLKPAGLNRTKAALAHRAWPDAYVTAHLLAHMLERVSVDELVTWSAEPALLPRVPFGTSRGRPWHEVDDGFLYWVLSKNFDEDVVFTVKTEVARRAADRASETRDA